jgi:hypothetical protein
MFAAIRAATVELLSIVIARRNILDGPRRREAYADYWPMTEVA